MEPIHMLLKKTLIKSEKQNLNKIIKIRIPILMNTKTNQLL